MALKIRLTIIFNIPKNLTTECSFVFFPSLVALFCFTYFFSSLLPFIFLAGMVQVLFMVYRYHFSLIIMFSVSEKFEGLAASTDVMEYAQAPSTPGLVEEPNLSSVQEALASDDHLEHEDHNLTELAAKENLENPSGVSSLHYGDSVAADWNLLNDTNHDAALSIPAEENGYILSEQKIKQAKSPGDSPSVAVTGQISSGNPF